MLGKYQKSKVASLVGLALSASSFTLIADEKEDDVEVIEVKGVRSSLISALAAKKGAESVSDSIIAEQIGKSSDENIAQALARISGVSLDRNGGDTQTVTVRGVQAALNDIKLNGVSMTSNTGNQAVDLSLFSADVLSRIDVVKSPSANQEEGSLGAAINLQTRAPLAAKENVNIVTIEGNYNDLREDTKPRLAYTFINNLSAELGVSGSLFFDQRNERKDEFNIFNSNIRKFSTNSLTNNAAKRVINAQTGELIAGDTWAISPNFYLNRMNLDDKTKQGGTVTVQYKPSDLTNLRFDASFSNQEIDHLQAHTRMHAMHRNPYEVFVQLGDGTTSNKVVGVNTGHVGSLNQSGQWLNTTDSLILGAQIDHTINEDWEIKARVGHSKSDLKFSDAFRMNWQAVNAGKIPYTRKDEWCSVMFNAGPEGDQISEMNFCNAYDGNDPSTMKLTQIRSDRREVDDTKSSAYIDVTHFVGGNFITAVEFGIKYTDRTKQARFEEVFVNPPQFENQEVILASDVPGSANSSITEGHFLDGIAPAGTPKDWIFPDIDAAIALAYPNGLDDSLFVPNPLKAWTVEEKTYGGYGQVNFELADGDAFGNFGIRYAKTEVSSKGHSGIRFNGELPFLSSIEGTTYNFPVSDEHSYDNWLPSATINWLISEDLIFRASAAKVMARPSISTIRTGFDIKAQNLEEDPRGSGFNTKLNPFIANQYDLSLEWYFDEGALLSAAIFNKDFSSFTYTKSASQQFDNPITGNCLVDRSVYDDEEEKLSATGPCADVNFTQTVNGGSAEIKGLEVSYQQNYTMLPGWFSHLGSSVNYTYADSEAIVAPDNPSDPFNGLPFINTSKHSANATLFWENDAVSARLAYAYRSEALSQTTNKQSSIVRDARGTLDFTLSYAINEDLKVSFSALNLTDSYDKFYEVLADPIGKEAQGIVREFSGDITDASKDRTKAIFDYGSSYRLSVRYSF